MPLAQRCERFSKELKVLIVEDSRADAELMIQQLRRAGLNVVPRVVMEEEEFRQALAENPPDVVLADDKLPRFSGRRALRIARHHDPCLPVIMVTGTLSEDRIVRLSALGLTNYVLKDRLLRLGQAVVEAVDRASDRRQALQDRSALASSERRFRAVAESAGDALIVVDEDGQVVFWNQTATRIFGHEASRMVGGRASELAPPSERTRLEDAFAKLLEADDPPEPCTIELSALRADGTEFPAELSLASWDEDGRWFFSAKVRDITGRKEAARTRQILSKAVEQTANSVMITNLEGRIEWVNPAFEAITGYSLAEVAGKTPRILKTGKQSAALYEQLWADITAGGTFFGEFTNRKKDGTEYVQRSVIFPITAEDGSIEQFVGVGQDVTQEHLLAQQLHQAQKMEAVGQLAGGIAHDFNNILTGILTNAQLAEMSLPEEGGELGEYLADVIQATRRGADLVKRLMSLARPEAGSPRAVDVRQVVDEAVRMVRRMLPESIEIAVDHHVESLPAHLDDGGLHHVLLNLATNARDAMPDGGRLYVGTAKAVMPDRSGRPSPSIVIRFRDTGVGMTSEVASRVFEPFFTTKEAGKGTGLGLSMVYRFITNLGGTVMVDSAPGHGTTMTLAIPIVQHGAESSAAGDVPATGREPVSTGATILLAEDQDDIRRIATRVLERAGYRVLTAADGVEAMGILGRERGKLDLVVADLVMPRGGGGMLYRSSRGWADQPSFLFMSGYATDELNGDGALLGTVPFIAKPWSVDDLLAKVAEQLECR